MLGAEQSGFIADLGYETFQKILKEAVMEIKTEEFGDTFTDVNAGETEEFTTDCIVESDLELLIPATYVPQEGERISLYQQLDNMDSAEQTAVFREHLRDRFGPIPQETEELIKIVALRREARRYGVERLVLKGGKMRLYFVSSDNIAYYQSSAFGRILSFVAINPRRSVISEKNGKNMILVHKVPDVEAALEVFRTASSLPAQ